MSPALAEDCAEGGRLLGLDRPLRLPRRLVELIDAGVEWVALDEGQVPAAIAERIVLGVGFLGAEMSEYYVTYEFDRYMPRAWPLAFDGGGALFCLDLRGGDEDPERLPVVWCDAGALDWDGGSHLDIAPDFDAFAAWFVRGS